MNHDSIELKIKEPKRLGFSATFSKSWGVWNPTTHTLKFIDRHGTTALIPTVNAKHMSTKYVYVGLGYDFSNRSNFTTREDIQEALTRQGDHLTAQGEIPIEAILNASRGLYVKDLDIVIGLSHANLEFPEDAFTNVVVEEGSPSVFQYFYNSDKIKRSRVAVILNGQATEIGVRRYSEMDNGLYVIINDGASATLELVETDPVVANNIYELSRIAEEVEEKREKKELKGIDVSLFNKHLDGLNNRVSVGLARVDSEIEEGFKAREFMRKDYESEVKSSRGLIAEETKLINDNVKTTSTLLTSLAKVI